METTKTEGQRLVKALEDGIAAGKAETQVGAQFLSAWPSAAKHGYDAGTIERNAFTAGYLSVIPSDGVTVSPEGVVARPEPKTTTSKAGLSGPATHSEDTHMTFIAAYQSPVTEQISEHDMKCIGLNQVPGSLLLYVAVVLHPKFIVPQKVAMQARSRAAVVEYVSRQYPGMAIQSVTLI